MGGGLMQLVAYGAQDIYLTGNPQITFFKIVYRRHTNFAIESIEQTFNGNPDFGKKVTCNISRNGDLISRIYLRVELPTISVAPGKAFRWVNWLGHVLIKSVEIEIGGQRIDKHCGEWLHVWNELTQTSGRALGYANMVGNDSDLTKLYANRSNATTNLIVPGTVLYIPLQFWFCTNPGLALPLIALQYHEVKINLEMRDWRELSWVGTVDVAGNATVDPQYSGFSPSISQASLYIDYYFLDTEERKRFAQVSHEYLITQLQWVDESSTISNPKIKLVFNHPCKELIFMAQRDDVASNTVVENSSRVELYGGQSYNFTDAQEENPYIPAGDLTVASGTGGYGETVYQNTVAGDNMITQAKLQLNGHDRFSPIRDGRFFNLVQPYQHHQNIPSRGINVYSFALKPEEHQPSGSCNMSRIDTAMLEIKLSNKTSSNKVTRIKIYTVNYNVLRIMSGMGGLAYSN